MNEVEKKINFKDVKRVTARFRKEVAEVDFYSCEQVDQLLSKIRLLTFKGSASDDVRVVHATMEQIRAECNSALGL